MIVSKQNGNAVNRNRIKRRLRSVSNLIFVGIALKLEPVARKISIILFVLVLLGAIAAERENVISYFAQAGLITLVLNVIMMLVAFYLGQFFTSGIKQKKCITIECGLQNGTLVGLLSLITTPEYA